MSKSVHSPTARLLQTSRLFSLPRPLPPPSLDSASSTGLFRASETATTPYPTHQAIATPASSHFRGDWGLKRPLPGKATRYTSTPIIRVNAQDNIQHITDFESAADHTLTERKWREMGIPMMVNDKDYYTTKDQKRSVYEEALDNTDPDAGKNRASSSRSSDSSKSAGSLDVKRWKYNGPSISGMREGDFNLYVMKTIRSRKDEFRKFMIDRLVDKRVRDEETQSRDRYARQLSAYRIQQIRQEVVQNYDVEEKRLREEHTAKHLGSELTAAICDFLDLPGVIPEGHVNDNGFASRLTAQLANDEPGPPTTHPAAGLSHLRSNAVLDMHPLWGPQAERTPVLARVVRPRITVGGQDNAANIGVGGVVARENPTIARSAWQDRSVRRDDLPLEENWLDANRMTQELDPDLPNGNKIWVQPGTARIDEKGHIYLNTSRSSKEAIAVKTAKEEPILQATSGAIYTEPAVAPPGTKANANFGVGLPDQRQLKGRSFKGFDGESETVTRIKEIMAQGRS
ncbi:unnamed protein product [Zymoseptoria tritici ST99CH_3D7]|uniref:Uncharacterized protein n=1 Tax=Zymoseptoria tritici (strain ST99CH_3D7) TaxID=1276538 RepID=A0A1X7RU57_ZYMT9|nr:unnamed protein product [Zymoseptoria tritici ST99CH_3D7]